MRACSGSTRGRSPSAGRIATRAIAGRSARSRAWSSWRAICGMFFRAGCARFATTASVIRRPRRSGCASSVMPAGPFSWAPRPRCAAGAGAALSLLSPTDAVGEGDDAGLPPARAAGGAQSGHLNIPRVMRGAIATFRRVRHGWVLSVWHARGRKSGQGTVPGVLTHGHRCRPGSGTTSETVVSSVYGGWPRRKSRLLVPPAGSWLQT